MMSEDEWFYDMSGDILREWEDEDEDEYEDEDPWDGLWIDKDGTVHEGDQEDEY